MITIEQVIYVIPILALTASILYYSFNLRTANKAQQLAIESRQAQIFMNLYDTYRDKEFRSYTTELRGWSWQDFDEFWDKYGEANNPEAWNIWITVALFYNGMGVLLMKNLIEIELIEELFSNVVFGAWSRMGDIILEHRNRQKRHLASRDTFHGFEYLYKELEKRATILE